MQCDGQTQKNILRMQNIAPIPGSNCEFKINVYYDKVSWKCYLPKLALLNEVLVF